MTSRVGGSRSAFGQQEANSHPLDGVVFHKNVDTVNVRVVGAVLRNVPVAPPLTIEQVTEGDTVALFWDSTDTPSVIAVLGRKNARASDARLDTTPPQAPIMLRVVQDNSSGPFLEWNVRPSNQPIAYFEVDARQPGGAWGYGKYPFSEGTNMQHFPRYSVPLQCRVRSVDLRGNTSAWSVCADLLVDTLAPPEPEGLETSSDIDVVQLSWTGPTPTEARDLAGFEVYRATESDGSDAVLDKKVGVALSTTVWSAPGVTYYFNLKAFDMSGNVSDFGPVWVPGGALEPGGQQLLVNSDFSLDSDGDGDADQWLTGVRYNATVSHGTGYGAYGGKGYKVHLEDASITRAAIAQFYSASQDAPIIPPIVGRTYVMTAYVRSAYPGDWSLSKDEFLIDGYLHLRCSLVVSNGSEWQTLTADADGQIIESNAYGSTWKRIRYAHTLTEEDLELVIPDATAVGYYMLFQIAGAGRFVDVYFDRPKLELDCATPWTPASTPPGGASGLDSFGLSSDASGISSEGGRFVLAADGVLYSPLSFREQTSAPDLPAADSETQIFLWHSPTSDYLYLVIAYLDGSTERYNYLRLDTASPSWAYGTALPDP